MIRPLANHLPANKAVRRAQIAHLLRPYNYLLEIRNTIHKLAGD